MTRGSRVLSWVVLGAVAFGIVIMLSLVMYQQGLNSHDSDRQQAEIAALQAGLDEANERLERRGEDPVPVPSVAPGADPRAPQVIIGDQGPGPTPAQIAAAVSEYCSGGRCEGSGPTKAQVSAAVAEYCADGACRGEPGADAPPAPAGKQGERGPGPTAEQIAAAVDAYCAAGACRGADGTNGSDGANGLPGKDGRGIAKTECHSTGDWIITYTDGTAGTTPGPCRVVQQAPTPTPSTTTTKGR